MTKADMEKAISEVWALFRENSVQLKETRENIEALNKKTDEHISALTKNVNRVSNDIETLKDKWGVFIERFLAPGIPRAFQERGIPIKGTSQRQKRTIDGANMEIDILGVNADCVLAVEVKSTLSVKDVTDFLKKLPNFKLFFPEYKGYTVYGGVAGIEIAGDADKFAYRKGLWVIGQAGDTVAIKNDAKFNPQVW